MWVRSVLITEKGTGLSNENPPELSSADELAGLRSENQALRDQLDTRRTKGPLWRRVLAGVLAVLAIVAVVAAVQAVWVETTLQDEDQFVATFQPLQQDSAVVTALSVRAADGVLEAAGVQTFVSDALPDELDFLASSLTTAIEDLVAKLANEVLQSDAATSAWTATLRVTHKGVSAVLAGNDRALVSTEGKVSIDLDQIAVVVLDRVEAAGLDLPDFDVSLGQVVIYENEDLAAAQAVAQSINTMGWFLPLLALVLIAGAIWTSPNHRGMTQFLGFGTALGLLLSLVALRISRYAIVDGIEDEIRQEAAGAVWDTVLLRLTQATWALLLFALIIGLIAWVTGPSKRAGRVAAWTSQTLDTWRRPTEEQPGGFTAFLVEWKRMIQWGIVVVGLLVVLLGPAPSGLLVIITAAIVLGIVVLVEVFTGPERTPAENLDRADV